jgi:hypothetical protein
LSGRGRPREFCSNACRQFAYRVRRDVAEHQRQVGDGRYENSSARPSTTVTKADVG